MSGQEVNSDEAKPTAKAVPHAIALLRLFITDNLPTLHGDAYIVATVVAELQDRCLGRPVGFWIGQLAERCGMGCKNPRRLRAAIKFLSDHGYLEVTVPPAGSRQQTLFKLLLKSPAVAEVDPRQGDGDEQPTPYQNGSDSQATPNQIDGGEELTPVETVARPPSERYGDPRQNGSTSNPVLTNPVYSAPNTKNLLNPPEEEMGDSVDSFKLDAVQKTGKPSRRRQQLRFQPGEIEQLYQAYPKKAEAVAARTAIAKALQKVPFSELLPKVQAFAAAVRASGSEIKFVKNPATWFNKGCWDDDLSAWTQKPTVSQTSVGRPSLTGTPGQVHQLAAKPSNDVSRFL